MDEKRFRFDLFIALCALLVSSIAAGASAYQTYVINQQYQASIWPYLGFQFSTDTDKLALFVKNYGLGPALIQSVEITREGKPVRSFEDYIVTFERPGGKATVGTSTIGQGSIIPASDSVTLLSVQNSPEIVKAIVSQQRSLDMSICYCSLLGRCWIRYIHDPTYQPRDIRVCPLPKTPRTLMFELPR